MEHRVPKSSSSKKQRRNIILHFSSSQMQHAITLSAKVQFKWNAHGEDLCK